MAARRELHAFSQSPCGHKKKLSTGWAARLLLRIRMEKSSHCRISNCETKLTPSRLQHFIAATRGSCARQPRQVRHLTNTPRATNYSILILQVCNGHE